MKTAQKPMPDTETTQLQVNQWIKASPARIFTALTTPEEMTRWFARGLPCKIEANVTPGGSWRINIQRPDGSNHVAFGRYKDIVPGKKVSFTWGWEGKACSPDKPAMIEASQDDSLVTIELAEKTGGTEVTLTHERLPGTVAVERHSEGWTGCLASLADYLTQI